MASSHEASSISPNVLIGAMDDQSAALILQLQIEDIATIFAASQGKRRASEALNDHEYALQLCQQELETTMTILNDRVMGQSISRAVQEDRHILAREAETEVTIAQNRRLACQLEGRAVPAVAAAPSAPSAMGSSSDAAAVATAEEEYLAKLMALNVSEAEGAKLLNASTDGGTVP
ncbi:Zinc finger RING/FYVE/PHD-type protein [Botryosphaeria dothidea]|uniref:Zinc finger RING/FYVE/PHD-type protein n=1 Tax=Botryosphaeria dothidea TaxID=55169 RepID=A0A8H4IV91_9PEZI|nr:Zinc finger RING/FYVE/PHD-type protein [Botryosphaeria dothidea]